MPSVLTVFEVHGLLAGLDDMKWLMASLLYGAGLRLRECLKLRVKDVDFEYRQIIVRDGKGQKDRVTMIYTHVMNKVGRGARSPFDADTPPRRMEQKTARYVAGVRPAH